MHLSGISHGLQNSTSAITVKITSKTFTYVYIENIIKISDCY